MSKPFVMSMAQIQPSQLYLNEAKVASVTDDTRLLAPVPVTRLGGRVVLTDGHTWAFVAWQSGRTEVEVEWDREELDWEAYEICVAWCEAEGIRTVADLASRIVPAEEYAVVWQERCARMQRQLAVERAGKQGRA